MSLAHIPWQVFTVHNLNILKAGFFLQAEKVFPEGFMSTFRAGMAI